jgi:hypothetical protein
MKDIQKPEVPRSQSVFGVLVYWITVLAAIMCILGPLIAFVNLDANIINPYYEMSNIFGGMKPNFELQDLQADAMEGTYTLKVEDVAKFDDPEDVGRDVDIRIIDGDGRGEIATLVSLNRDTNELQISEPLINSYDAQQAEIGELTVWDSPGTKSLALDAKANDDYLKLATIDRIEEPTEGRRIALVIQDDTNREQVFVKSVDIDNNIVSLEDPLTNSYSITNNAIVTQVTAKEEIGGHFWINNLTNGDGLTQLALALGCAVGIPAMGGAALILAFREKSYGWALGAMFIVLLIVIPALGLV